MEQIIKQHLRKYPLSQPQDIIKLLFQSEFGGGHLIADKSRAKERLKQERKKIKTESGSLPEDVGDGFFRLSLSCPLLDDTVCRLFFLSAEPCGTKEGFAEKLSLLKAILPELYDKSLAEHTLNGEIPRHSEAYRKAYTPSYRIVAGKFMRFYEVFKQIDSLPGQKTVAIDGQSAAGKTTLAELLFSVYREKANLFHTDDYFLPPEKKTKQRLSQPGGNVDYERFAEEIIKNLSKKSFIYFPYDCRTQALKHGVTADKQELNIIEGSYSLHPYFGEAYDLKILMTVSPERQKERIYQRNPDLAQMFFDVWIPLENKYLSAFPPKADLVYKTE